MRIVHEEGQRVTCRGIRPNVAHTTLKVTPAGLSRNPISDVLRCSGFRCVQDQNLAVRDVILADLSMVDTPRHRGGTSIQSQWELLRTFGNREITMPESKRCDLLVMVTGQVLMLDSPKYQIN